MLSASLTGGSLFRGSFQPIWNEEEGRLAQHPRPKLHEALPCPKATCLELPPEWRGQRGYSLPFRPCRPVQPYAPTPSSPKPVPLIPFCREGVDSTNVPGSTIV